LFIFIFLTIVLSVFRFTASDYLFFYLQTFRKQYIILFGIYKEPLCFVVRIAQGKTLVVFNHNNKR